MVVEERRRKLLEDLPLFKLRPDFLELYMYHLFKDKSFLTEDLKTEKGEPSKPSINKKTSELVIMMGLIILEGLGE
ncbi:MAG: hypothetical protein ACRC45_03615 [Cetobacterium sp.]